MVTESAPATFHSKVDEPPGTIVNGVAVKDSMIGASSTTTVTEESMVAPLLVRVRV